MTRTRLGAIGGRVNVLQFASDAHLLVALKGSRFGVGLECQLRDAPLLEQPGEDLFRFSASDKEAGFLRPQLIVKIFGRLQEKRCPDWVVLRI